MRTSCILQLMVGKAENLDGGEEHERVTLFSAPPVPWGNYEPAASMLITFQLLKFVTIHRS